MCQFQLASVSRCRGQRWLWWKLVSGGGAKNGGGGAAGSFVRVQRRGGKHETICFNFFQTTEKHAHTHTFILVSLTWSFQQPLITTLTPTTRPLMAPFQNLNPNLNSKTKLEPLNSPCEDQLKCSYFHEMSFWYWIYINVVLFKYTCRLECAWTWSLGTFFHVFPGHVE